MDFMLTDFSKHYKRWTLRYVTVLSVCTSTLYQRILQWKARLISATTLLISMIGEHKILVQN